MSAPSSPAVFLSCASQDAGVARKLCAALQAAGVEVWFDQSGLRGSEAWEQCIRRQITECALFLPVISAHTQRRPEGYFRREWSVAVERVLGRPGGIPFLLPVVIDSTHDTEALVPGEFMVVQWERLPGGEPTPQFMARVKELLQMTGRVAAPAPALSQAPRRAPRRWSWLFTAIGAGVAGWLLSSFEPSFPPQAPANPGDSGASASTPSPAGDITVAVLPFVNLSDDRENEYFSDGISEELMNVLGRVPGVQVAARTSSFSFKGRNVPVSEISRVLRVSYVVEGSVRRSGDRVRITAQLIKAADGLHAWTGTFERELKDLLAVQEEIVQTLVTQLRGPLAGGAAVRADVEAASRGGTRNPDAYGSLLQGRFFLNRGTPEDYGRAVDYFRAAIRVDPAFALARAELARAYVNLAQFALTPRSFSEAFQLARTAAEQTLAVEPRIAGAQVVLAQVRLVHDWDVPGAHEAVRRALELAPNDPAALSTAAMMTLFLGLPAPAVRLCRRAVELEPLNPQARVFLSVAHFYSGQLPEAEHEIRRALELNPVVTLGPSMLGYIRLQQGRYEEAIEAAGREQLQFLGMVPVALARLRQGRPAEAEKILAYLIDKYSERMAFNIAQIYACRGEVEPAFAWLHRACEQKDSGLIHARIDPFLVQLHEDPRWEILLHRLGLVGEAAERVGASYLSMARQGP